MRIIKNPNPVEEKIHICEKCKCEFAYNKSDLKSESYNNGIIGPGCFGYLRNWIVCPNCGEPYTIYDSRTETHKRTFGYVPTMKINKN